MYLIKIIITFDFVIQSWYHNNILNHIVQLYSLYCQQKSRLSHFILHFDIL